MQYLPSGDPRELLDEARRYAHQHAELLAGTIKSYPIRSLTERRLRIGYVSADFREHALSFAFELTLAAHEHQRLEIFCYASVPRGDATTQRLHGYSDHWRSIVGLSDAQAAELIRQDAIDILVDLDGHTAGNQLLVFARRPAPIQATYLGYQDTTGLPAIDYFITDSHANPPGLTDAYFQERLIRLPDCTLCYRAGLAPEIGEEPPGRQSGQVTFSCLNNLAKVSDQVLALWLRVLAAVPGS
jgi:protein O-GlcNAc transferase